MFLSHTWFSLSDLLHSVWQSLGPSTFLQIMQFHSFLWLSNTALYICTTSALSNPCWWIFRLFPCPGYYNIVLQWTVEYICLFKLCFPQGTCPVNPCKFGHYLGRVTLKGMKDISWALPQILSTSYSRIAVLARSLKVSTSFPPVQPDSTWLRPVLISLSPCLGFCFKFGWIHCTCLGCL